MAGKFESDPESLRAAAHMDEREADVVTHGETLAANTTPRVGHGAIGEVVESAVERGIKIAAHDITAAVRKFYRDVGDHFADIGGLLDRYRKLGGTLGASGP